MFEVYANLLRLNMPFREEGLTTSEAQLIAMAQANYITSEGQKTTCMHIINQSRYCVAIIAIYCEVILFQQVLYMRALVPAAEIV